MISLKGIISDRLRRQFPPSAPEWKGGVRDVRTPKPIATSKGVSGTKLGGRKKS